MGCSPQVGLRTVSGMSHWTWTLDQLDRLHLTVGFEDTPEGESLAGYESGSVVPPEIPTRKSGRKMNYNYYNNYYNYQFCYHYYCCFVLRVNLSTIP